MKRKKIIRIVSISAVLLLIPVMGYLVMCMRTIISISGDSEHLLFDEDIDYYENIKHCVKISDSGELDINNIFSFEWDRAYITKSYDGEDEEFYKNSNTKDRLLTFEKQDGIRCIAFLKGDKLVFEYRYLLNDIQFLPSGKFFTRENAIFEIIKKGNWWDKTVVLKLKE